MNCNTCRYELSQCLDGRLPSGRRTLVMQHAATCVDCGTFWVELQAAQQLTLQLQQPRVGSAFRESLWERIKAGEGTPAAVFREPVPMLTKVRYTLSGAAAAAAVLAGVLWLSPEHDALRERVIADGGPQIVGPAPVYPVDTSPIGEQWHGQWQHDLAMVDNPLLGSAQRLTFDLVAVETARQLEQSHAAATLALRRLGAANDRDDGAVRQVLENADELHDFGELLLDLRDRNRLFFTDAGVEPALRFTVKMLGQSQLGRRDAETIRTFVAPALEMESARLAGVSRTISVVPSSNPREEMDVLLRLNTQRPEVFPKLFFVFGSDTHLQDFQFQAFRAGTFYLMPDDCGPSWVAPRSQVESRDRLLRILRSHGPRGQNGEQVELRLEVKTAK